MTSDSEYLTKGPCPSCGSSDANASYTDGHSHCFSCGAHTSGNGSTPTTQRKRMAAGLIDPGSPQALPKRSLTEETCSRWRYTVGSHRGQACQIANYVGEDGSIIAQHIRYPDKGFEWVGDHSHCGLYGQWLWRDKGKKVVITEGEIDAMSVSQCQDGRWPVVSIRSGAGPQAKKDIQKALEWLEGFEEVVFMFDMDEVGQKAARECALLLSPGKAKIASLPLKDANDMLKAGRVKETIDAIWGAKTYRPDGIVAGTDLWEAVTRDESDAGLPYPWQGVTDVTRGLRKSELVTLTAGSGIGKSAICRELAHHLLGLGETVGYIALEESTKRTALGLMGIALNRPIHLNREGIDEAQLKVAFSNSVGSGRCYLYDHFGSCDSDNLLSRIRYLARGCGCGWIILDHLSIVVSGIGDGDERRLIDNTMTKLRALVQETGVGLILVSHLKRPEGRGHEEGAQTSLAQLRGSAAIAQLSDMVIGLERNGQDADRKHITTVRVLKNRFSGETGVACELTYNPTTGRLAESSSGVFQAVGASSDF